MQNILLAQKQFFVTTYLSRLKSGDVTPHASDSEFQISKDFLLDSRDVSSHPNVFTYF